MKRFLLVVPSTEASADDLRKEWFPDRSFAAPVPVRDALLDPDVDYVGTIGNYTVMMSIGVVEGLCGEVATGNALERQRSDLWCFGQVGEAQDYRQMFLRIERGEVLRYCGFSHASAPLAIGSMLPAEGVIVAQASRDLADFWCDYADAPTLASRQEAERRAAQERERASRSAWERSKLKSVSNKGRRTQQSPDPKLLAILAPFEQLVGKGVLQDIIKDERRLGAALSPTEGGIEEARPVDGRQHDVSELLIPGLITMALGVDQTSEAFLSAEMQPLATL